jgi:hypothetical protein
MKFRVVVALVLGRTVQNQKLPAFQFRAGVLCMAAKFCALTVLPSRVKVRASK